MTTEDRDSTPPEAPETSEKSQEAELVTSDVAASDAAGETAASDVVAHAVSTSGAVITDGEAGSQAPAILGVERYVHAAFFGTGLLVAYLLGKILLAAWNALADWPTAVQSVPQLIQYSEEERGTATLVIGAVLGLLLVLRYYRRPSVRAWASDVAGELARVTWPSKETVTNGTLVVLIAGAVATVYVALLDRFWGYLTNLVYGA